MTIPATIHHDVQHADGWKSFEHHRRYAVRVVIGTCFEPSWDESDHYPAARKAPSFRAGI